MQNCKNMKMHLMNNWIYRDTPLTQIPEGAFAFVYKITNNLDGRIYIGKKQFHSYQKKSKKEVGKNRMVTVRKKKVVLESDWKKYWGSCKELQEDVKKFGETNFTREILHIVPSKGSASYYEMVEQVKHKVLESDNSYNGHIDVRVHKRAVKGKKPMRINKKDIK